MPTKSPETIVTHGAAGYNAGCKCDTCTGALLRRSRRWRRSRSPHIRRTMMCVMCGEMFHPRGHTTHEMSCRG